MYKTLRISILLVLILLMGSCCQGCGRKQQVNISYSFAISPPTGETLRDVTVFLPFPNHNGKPLQQIFKSLQRDYDRYLADDFPDAKIYMTQTKYGKMLAIKVPEIDSRGFGLEGAYGFEQPYSDEPVAPEYMLSPSRGRHKLKNETKTGFLSNTKIFAKCENPSKIGIASTYHIQILSPSILPLDYIPENQFQAYLGFKTRATEISSLVHYFETDEWQDTSILDYGFDRSNQ